MKPFAKTLLTATLIALAVTACAPSISSDTYSTTSAGQVNRVVAGVVVSSRPVKVSGDSLGAGGGMIGTIAGGAAGAIAGSSIGGGRGSLLTGIGGALAGGALGNMAEKKLTSQQGIEYVIKLTDGSMVSIVQGASPVFRRGQHVLIEYGARSRVTLDPDYPN